MWRLRVEQETPSGFDEHGEPWYSCDYSDVFVGEYETKRAAKAAATMAVATLAVRHHRPRDPHTLMLCRVEKGTYVDGGEFYDGDLGEDVHWTEFDYDDSATIYGWVVDGRVDWEEA